MKKKKIMISAAIISAIIILAYIIIGNPIIAINNKKLQREVVSINSDYVELNNIVPFEWDEVYTFEPYASKEQIEDIIGFKSNYIQETVSEGMVQLLFIKDHKVVCSVCGYSNALGYRIDFEGRIMYVDHAVFSVERDSGIVKLNY
ncbi:hypothetical protein DES36_11565 [Alkalibaculum bacchi]|jgi:hypothetical protein|uniref:Uncharacterized protein n=1 Tax=Alkalibaculum bacchi TaxID=645887 RepID=A0A366I154_9FIRM|nr:hypothetical protein [Alkalibaculum bacchi]RBP61066.1 hypothetical protein DES36_11565 [Alkalibaculum bacchi]